MKWKYSTRVYNGKKQPVKVHHKCDGGYLIRKVGWKNKRD
jgi:hypothetical protein